MYFVYIIKNHQGLFYKGFTQNLDKRIFEHNNDLSRYTSGKSPRFWCISKNLKQKQKH
ncbi:GIY-YIG nuclease family protein [Flavobacterium sp. LB3R33]|uniref:GIY-YIG nuclease family protein n=1 Tax=Flavobacterium sp. LB3R33 TaxID=3401721 RepID=UPI003AAE096A